MVEVLKIEYWSKSESLLLPLTGIKDDTEFEIMSYLFWDDYTIHDYELCVKIEYGYKYQEFKNYLNTLYGKKTGTLIKACHDYEGFSIIVFDMFAWSNDVDKFLEGKYSQFSERAKELIQNYHTFRDERGKPMINVSIYSCLFPKEEQKCLDNMTPIEYVSVHYGIDEETLNKLGEICSVYDVEKETLLVTGQNDITNVSA